MSTALKPLGYGTSTFTFLQRGPALGPRRKYLYVSMVPKHQAYHLFATAAPNYSSMQSVAQRRPTDRRGGSDVKRNPD